jgi:transposase-like protein
VAHLNHQKPPHQGVTQRRRKRPNPVHHDTKVTTTPKEIQPTMAAQQQATQFQQRQTEVARRLETEAVDRYTNQQQSVRQIARAIGCSYGTVHAFLRACNVPMRPKGHTQPPPPPQSGHPRPAATRSGGAAAVTSPRQRAAHRH